MFPCVENTDEWNLNQDSCDDTIPTTREWFGGMGTSDVVGSWAAGWRRTLLQSRHDLIYPLSTCGGEVGGVTAFCPWGTALPPLGVGFWEKCGHILARRLAPCRKGARIMHNAGFFRAFSLVDRMVLNSGHHVFLRGQSRSGSIGTNNFVHDCHVFSGMHDTANLHYFPNAICSY